MHSGNTPKRKPISLTAVQYSHPTRASELYLYAICNDGTIWFIGESDKQWHHMKDIPQGKLTKTKNTDREATA